MRNIKRFILLPVLQLGLRQVARDIILNTAMSSVLIPSRHRWRLMRIFGMDVERSVVYPGTFFGSRLLSVGYDSMINYGCFFDTTSEVKIGRGCSIGMEVLFCTSSHEIGSADKRAGLNTSYAITIGDGTWVGARCAILPGVQIGSGCVIAAGSIVVRDCEKDSLYAGNPAKLVRKLSKEGLGGQTYPGLPPGEG
jgi:maltose O-acetyltransferase